MDRQAFRFADVVQSHLALKYRSMGQHHLPVHITHSVHAFERSLHIFVHDYTLAVEFQTFTSIRHPHVRHPATGHQHLVRFNAPGFVARKIIDLLPLSGSLD